MQHEEPLTAEIFLRLAAGDTDEFELLYRRKKDFVYQTALTIIRSPDDAVEICQETFATLWGRRDYFLKVKDLDEYVYTVTRNVAVSWRRRVRYELERRVELIDTSPVRAPDVLLESKEFFILYKARLERLPPQQRKIFNMAREEKKSHEEIAAALGISVNTVCNHMKEALRTLREWLARHDGKSSAPLRKETIHVVKKNPQC